MTDEQAAAFAQLRRLAAPMRLRVVPDAEGYPLVHGRLGDIEFFHVEGVSLAAYAAGNKARLGRLLSLPNITRHQVGASEVRVLFPVAMLAEVARVIQARRRKQISPEHLAKLRGSLLQRGSGGAESTPAPGPEVQAVVPHPRAPHAGHRGGSVLVIEVTGKVL